jgi:hypothetical protein
MIRQVLNWGAMTRFKFWVRGGHLASRDRERKVGGEWVSSSHQGALLALGVKTDVAVEREEPNRGGSLKDDGTQGLMTEQV